MEPSEPTRREDPVNMHKNARSTPAGRALLVERIEAGEKAGVVAGEMGVSRRTRPLRAFVVSGSLLSAN